ncbi:hypothetical protein P7C71_g4749, partial [Lecanoromycetidae sp. Uapishka_2]
MSTLLGLPHEILHNVLVNTSPDDLGRLCCCRTLNSYIKNNELLYKELYLKHFDGLLQDQSETELPWAIELKKLVKLQKILESKDAAVKALRQHTENSYWGPYLDDGSYAVDWEKMEAIMIILDHNMKLSSRDQHEFQGIIEVQEKSFIGATPNSFVSPAPLVPLQPSTPLESQDPYSVTGTWSRVVCFLDYSELFDFNFGDEEREEEGPADDQPRRPIDVHEAIRLIEMKIQVTKIEAPGEEDGQSLPVVHFKGTSSATRPHWDPNANSKIKGTVRLTKEGEVRWTTFSVYHGEERWRSEGIQVGGVRSARGVIGYWFDKNHDIHGPAGPTAFWKSHDGIEEQKARPMTGHGVQLFTVPLY